MARYPQGVSNFIPSYQAYQPDFTSMGKMLKIKQNKYDQNWKQLNKQYGALLYSETTHDQSQKVKDQLENEIDNLQVPIDGTETGYFRTTQEYHIIYRESIPTF